jgi:hypothetical protein
VDSSEKHNRKPENKLLNRYWWTVQRNIKGYQETCYSLDTGVQLRKNITGNQETFDRLDTGGQFRET